MKSDGTKVVTVTTDDKSKTETDINANANTSTQHNTVATLDVTKDQEKTKTTTFGNKPQWSLVLQPGFEFGEALGVTSGSYNLLSKARCRVVHSFGMVMDRHSELEFKFLADHVDPGAFKSWCMSLGPTRFNSAAFPDVYWRRGDNVVRHRLLWGGAGELTVKRRKSADSITDRQEIDLRFSYPFWFKHGDASIVVSLYEVARQPFKSRRFLEVEVEKESNVSDQVARNLLTLWSSYAAREFDLGDPCALSIYEMYSGRPYPNVVEAPPTCTRPPDGWRCTRGSHEDGPCAAVPVR